MYCPMCGQGLKVVERGDLQKQYRVNYGAWVLSGSYALPPHLPDESVHLICGTGCFTEEKPLVHHHSKCGTKFMPSKNAWSLTKL